ncbi:MAG TPA: hypothetical protein VKW09_15015 [bacterium]|nr:hypothetical protein [bacterium]
MRQVADAHGRFTIDFPENWVVRWVGDGYLRLSDNAAHDGVVGIGPAGADGSRADVIVDVRIIPAPISASAAATNAENGLRRLAAYRSLQAGPYSIGGVPAYYRFFTHIAHGARVFQAQVYVTQGRQLYVLSGTTRTDRAQIPRDFPLILRIIGTFRLLPQR